VVGRDRVGVGLVVEARVVAAGAYVERGAQVGDFVVFFNYINHFVALVWEGGEGAQGVFKYVTLGAQLSVLRLEGIGIGWRFSGALVGAVLLSDPRIKGGLVDSDLRRVLRHALPVLPPGRDGVAAKRFGLGNGFFRVGIAVSCFGWAGLVWVLSQVALFFVH